MNRAVELHDSKVLSIHVAGDDVVLRMSFYLHESSGVPAVDAGEGGWQQAVLVLEDGALLVAPARGELWIDHGRVRCSGAAFENILPLPFHAEGPVEVELEGNEGAVRA